MNEPTHSSGISWTENLGSDSEDNLITQYPPGNFLEKYNLLRVIILCIDCSWSMDGILQEAKDAAKGFVDEALAAKYEVGFIWWDDSVAAHLQPTTDKETLYSIIDNGEVRGGTNIAPALGKCISFLRNYNKQKCRDRVVAVIGDGDLGWGDEPFDLAKCLCADGVRIITRGIGAGADRALREIECSCLGYGSEDQAAPVMEAPRETTDSAATAIGMLSAEIHRK